MNSQFSMATATFGDRLCLEPANDIERGLDQTIVNENYTGIYSLMFFNYLDGLL